MVQSVSNDIKNPMPKDMHFSACIAIRTYVGDFSELSILMVLKMIKSIILWFFFCSKWIWWPYSPALGTDRPIIMIFFSCSKWTNPALGTDRHIQFFFPAVNRQTCMHRWLCIRHPVLHMRKQTPTLILGDHISNSLKGHNEIIHTIEYITIQFKILKKNHLKFTTGHTIVL